MLIALGAGVLLAEPEALPWRHTLFLQFEGASLSWVPTPEEENAALGLSFMAKFEGSELPPYDGDEVARQAVLQQVRAHLAGLGVRVVDARPPDWVPYTMAVIGGEWDDTAATSVVRGVAPEVDCLRANQRHVVFAFVGADEPTVQQATTISQEAGHAWGLDHVLGDGLIMSYDWEAPSSAFSQDCVELCEEACQGPDTVYCEAQHADHCPQGQQDSWAELLQTFGDDTPDTEPPTVTVLTPQDDEVLPPGSDLLVEIDVADDYGGVGWRFELEHDGELAAEQTAFERETTWPLTTLPDGSYLLRVIAEDHADHRVEHTVAFEVGEAAADESGGDDDAAGTTGAQQMDGGQTGGDEGGDDGSCTDEGCAACQGQGATPPGACLFLLLPVFTRRRARR